MSDDNFNEVKLSGVINGINDTSNKYIKFGLTYNKNILNETKNIYISLNIERDLYNKYKDFFVKGNKLHIKGYLNSYIDSNNKIQSFITVLDILNNNYELLNNRSSPSITYDPDGVMVWNGKRCESEPCTEEELKELEELLSEFTR